ncbi:MAG: 4'-phosphopantetheinyl transferase superfamily protein [Ruminococcaceae bacterium]|nr:4'-phosphopantetheinyl transferase superfamily protein [Oscillospiraceae bacterium]
MNTIYILNIWELAPCRDAALSRLSDERRQKVLAAHTVENALRSLGAGLLLRRFVGDGPFSYGEFGKPFLPDGPPFSLSHGGDLAVLAVGEYGTELGVDVEKNDRPWREAVVRRIFTDEEQLAFDGRGESFFRLWTRKEAVLKCRGSGFSQLSVFPVLQDRCAAGGKIYQLNTVVTNGHSVSLAVCGSAAKASICMMNIQSLLDFLG